MIKNYVFDLGRVLVGFDPEGYLRGLGFDGKRADELAARIFYGREWRLHDRGDLLTTQDVCAALEQAYPADAADIRRVLEPAWVTMHTPRSDAVALMEDCKKRGRVYILSNLAIDSYEYVKGFDFMRLPDGGVFSYQERRCKPEPEIYRILLDRYALIPDETVFLDDNADNITAAEKAGIHGILFTDPAAARAALETLG